jgi:hypothetical protein
MATKLIKKAEPSINFVFNSLWIPPSASSIVAGAAASSAGAACAAGAACSVCSAAGAS